MTRLKERLPEWEEISRGRAFQNIRWTAELA